MHDYSYFFKQLLLSDCELFSWPAESGGEPSAATSTPSSSPVAVAADEERSQSAALSWNSVAQSAFQHIS